MIKAQRRTWRRSGLLLGILVFLLTTLVVHSEMEATWTPSDKDNDGSGPLPLSMNQRQELLKLEDAIRSSPNPQETLMQVAQANEMDPQELVNLLNRNRQDMQAAGAGGGGGLSQQRNVWQSLISLGALGGEWAKAHPRVTATIGTSLLLGLYTSWTVPRTGFVVSTRKSLFSKGATTLFSPPTSYLEQVFLDNISDRPVSCSKKLYTKINDLLKDDANDESRDNNQQPSWLKVTKEASGDVKRAVTFSKSIEVDELRGAKHEGVEDDVVLESCWEQALSLLQKRIITEFVHPSGFLRFVSSEDGQGVLVVKGLGDWNGYGLIPLRIVSSLLDESDLEDSSFALTLNTVKGSQWDGQIHIEFDLESSSSLNVRATLIFSKGGRALSSNVATQMVQSIVDSLVTSMRTRTRQALARQSQSARFQKAAREKATNRRSSRSAKERAIEEMAADRRRRWQRSNPNSGHYRPSGDRMRSPNNAVY